VVLLEQVAGDVEPEGGGAVALPDAEDQAGSADDVDHPLHPPEALVVSLDHDGVLQSKLAVAVEALGLDAVRVPELQPSRERQQLLVDLPGAIQHGLGSVAQIVVAPRDSAAVLGVQRQDQAGEAEASVQAQLAHLPKVDEADVTFAADQDIAWVRVRAEKSVDEELVA